MLAMGRLATASRERKGRVWPGRLFIGQDQDRRVWTGNLPVVLVTINFSTFTVPVPNAVIQKLVTRVISRTVVGHRGMSSVFSISSGWSVMRQDDRHITLVRPARRPASGFVLNGLQKTSDAQGLAFVIRLSPAVCRERQTALSQLSGIRLEKMASEKN